MKSFCTRRVPPSGALSVFGDPKTRGKGRQMGNEHGWFTFIFKDKSVEPLPLQSEL